MRSRTYGSGQDDRGAGTGPDGRASDHEPERHAPGAGRDGRTSDPESRGLPGLTGRAGGSERAGGSGGEPGGGASRPERAPLALRALYPGYFALVMATGICSTALRDTGHPHLSGALLVTAIVSFAILCVAVTVRAIRYPGPLLADLTAPERGFAFLTFVAASDLLGVRLAADGHRTALIVLSAAGGVAWVALGYLLPAVLILRPRPAATFRGVNGTWFMWVVGTQSLAIAATTGDAGTYGYVRATALIAVLLWSVGVVLYLIIATLVLARLLVLPVRSGDLTSPYWVTMGATAITVLAAAQILTMAPSAAGAAARPVVAGLAIVLWAFGTWLIPLLLVFAARRPGRWLRPAYDPAWWSIVFPLGMYAVASMRLGQAARLPLIGEIGRAWTWLAIAAWSLAFLMMIAALGRAVVRAVRR